jgi:hypothetical protein
VDVPIHIAMSGQQYVVEVTPTEHMPVRWRWEGPMPGSEVLDTLLELGYHQQDIVDAFVFADPDFLVKLNRGDFNRAKLSREAGLRTILRSLISPMNGRPDGGAHSTDGSPSRPEHLA